MLFKDLIDPISEEEFVSEYKGKKPFVSRGNKVRKKFFSDIISWKKFSEYISNDRAVSGLQAIVPAEPMPLKLCMEKPGPNYLKPEGSKFWRREDYWFDAKRLQTLWYNNDTSIILTKAGKLTPNINSICGGFEKGYESIVKAGCAADAHFYCSQNKGAHSFECHADGLDNFIIHSIGKVHWKVYPIFTNGKKNIMTEEEESKHEPFIDEVLSEGDVLYLPKGIFHRAHSIGPRISISVQVAENQGAIDRNWYDFTPKFA